MQASLESATGSAHQLFSPTKETPVSSDQQNSKEGWGTESTKTKRRSNATPADFIDKYNFNLIRKSVIANTAGDDIPEIPDLMYLQTNTVVPKKRT
jgi:hypothetical protein